MLAYLALYVAIGMVFMTALCLTHLIVAEIRKYNAFDYWKEEFPKFEKQLKPGKILFNLLIWPVRFIQFAAICHLMYDVYDYNVIMRKEGKN